MTNPNDEYRAEFDALAAPMSNEEVFGPDYWQLIEPPERISSRVRRGNTSELPASGEMSEVMAAFMAAQDRAKSAAIRERVMCAQRMIQERGALTGKAPFGYAVAGEKYNKTLEPTDLGRAIVPRIFAEVIAGESRATIAMWLNSEGVTAPGGGSWLASSVGRLIKNRTT